MSHWRVGVDVGGTFTDFAALDAGSGQLLIEKTSTTPRNPALGIIEGLERLQKRGVPPEEIVSFLHGTTITTNAVIERKGVPIGLLLTGGLRGIPEVQSQLRKGSLYDLFYEKPLSLVAPELTFEIPERIGARGEILQPLDEAAVRAAARALRSRGVDSVAVCYLFSFAEPAHERRSRELLLDEMPGCFVSLSSETLPRIREWPRMSSTLLNAYLEPLLGRYVASLEAKLRDHGVGTRQLFIMQSNGGIMPFDAVLRGGRTIQTLLSGPAGGVQAGVRLAGAQGLDNLITMDIGGTSCDIAFIEQGRPLEVTEGEIDQHDIAVPMLDVTSIGAGGGTLAWLDPGGALNVGPQSAGADPGSVCYGRGGTTPTVTDANLVLGYLNPGYLLGGRLALDKAAAESALRTQIAEPLGMDVVQAAHGIIQIVNTRMADQIRVLAAKKAVHLGAFTLVAGGGAGPVHAAAVAEELGTERVLVPPSAGAFSAVGLLCTDVIHDYIRSEVRLLSTLSIDHIAAIFHELEERAWGELRDEGLGQAEVSLIREVDVRYAGQGFEMRVSVASGPLSAEEKEHIARRFHEVHARVRGHSAEAEPLEVVSYRLRARVTVPQYRPLPDAEHAEAAPADDAVVGSRLARFSRDGTAVPTAVWRRDRLRHGNVLEGPAIVEETHTTTVIPPGWHGSMDQHRNLILERRA